jgi:hypothetical protein
MKLCPAGRAHFAWSGHFVACIPCLAQMIFGGPPVGRSPRFRADFRPVELGFRVH